MTPAQYEANGTITAKEREALELEQQGFSQRTTALILGVSRTAIVARLENARRKIAAAERTAA